MKKITRTLITSILVLAMMLSLVTVASAEADYVWLEAESGTVSGTGFAEVNDGNASGGKGMQVFKSDTEETSVSYTFNIEEAGEYDIKILSLDSSVMHLTHYKVKLDDGQASGVPESSRAGVYNHYIGGSRIPAKWHDIAVTELEEGEHTITVIADSKRYFNDYIMTYFDAIAIAPAEWGWIPSGISRPRPPVRAEEVVISDRSITLRGGETYGLSAEVYPEDTAVKDVSWSSSNTNIATVSQDGVVTGISGGTAIITVTTVDGGYTDTCEVTVIAPKIISTLVKIADVTNTLQPGVSTNRGIVQIASAQAEGTVYEFEIPFTAPDDGEYEVYFAGSEHGVMHASSYSDYKVDGESKGSLSTQQHYEKKGIAEKADSTLDLYWYKLDELTLDTNEHTITFVFKNPRSLDGRYMFALEYLALVPKGTRLKLNSDNGAAGNLGEVLMSSVFIDETTTTEDLLLHMNAIDGSEVTWTSSNTDVIDEEGHVTQPGYYEEDAVVTLTANIPVTKMETNITAKKEFTITVPKKDEYSIKDFRVAYESGNEFGNGEADENLVATVRIANNTVEDRTAVLIMARYDKNGAMIDVATDAVSLTDELQTLSASMFIEEEFEGDKVEAFLWTDLGAKKLIDDSILIYEN